MSYQRGTEFKMGAAEQVPTHLENVGCIAQVAKVQQMSAMRSRLERDFLEGLPGKSVLQLREHLTAKLTDLREQAAHVMSDPPPEQVWAPSHAYCRISLPPCMSYLVQCILPLLIMCISRMSCPVAMAGKTLLP